MCIHFDSDNIRKAGKVLQLRGKGLHVAAKALELAQDYAFVGAYTDGDGNPEKNYLHYMRVTYRERTRSQREPLIFRVQDINEDGYSRFLVVDDNTPKLGRDAAIMKRFAGVDLDGFPTPEQLRELALHEVRELQDA